MTFVRLTVLTCKAPTIGIAGPEGPATWTGRPIFFNVTDILRMERQKEWGRQYTLLLASGDNRYKIDQTPEQIISTIRESA